MDSEVMPPSDQSATEVSIERIKAIDTTTAALKEWAVVCKALEEGRQVILLRKGGIMEYRQGFEVKHTDFFLYPTFEHQSKESLQPNYVNKLDIVLQNAPVNNRNRITSCAAVVLVKEITNKSVLGRLEKYHIWNDQYINVRFSYNPKRPLNVVVLRVYKMNTPLEVDVKPELTGCKSWIPVQLLLSDTKLQQEYDNQSGSAIDIVKPDCKPVFNDSEFTEIVTELQEVLNR
ncbi:MAG: DUF1802 family protein [Nitrosopumilales archaeon]|nr:DUF1802 family protein [Thermoproteota archaeon]MRN41170.1 DUF1802 family protein [Nitrosopumilales archaeon]